VFWLDFVVIGLIALGVVLWVGEPFIRRSRPPERSVTTEEKASLLLQKDVLYTAIRDLVFDFQTGKVDESDYTALRQDLEAEAVQVLQSLDTLAFSESIDTIERQVKALQASTTDSSVNMPAPLCRSCQRPLHGSENFCPACGQSLKNT
jgi:hypothetical protein